MYKRQIPTQSRISNQCSFIQVLFIIFSFIPVSRDERNHSEGCHPLSVHETQFLPLLPQRQIPTLLLCFLLFLFLLTGFPVSYTHLDVYKRQAIRIPAPFSRFILLFIVLSFFHACFYCLLFLFFNISAFPVSNRYTMLSPQ